MYRSLGVAPLRNIYKLHLKTKITVYNFDIPAKRYPTSFEDIIGYGIFRSQEYPQCNTLIRISDSFDQQAWINYYLEIPNSNVFV